MQDTNRLYTDLAWLWPLWGRADGEYAHYAGFVSDLMHRYARRELVTLLDVGCGGGKNVYTLKQSFDVTGLDISPHMLGQARALNPECSFVEADMRSFRLDRTFDAILIDDAISHMNTPADFEAAFRAAFAHLAPGGVLVVTPDVMAGDFVQNRTTCTSVYRLDGTRRLDVTFIENMYDRDPDDQRYEATIVYLIREDGELRVETDHWTLGLFSLETWRHVLDRDGRELHEVEYRQDEDVYTVFACVKP